jgi:uncharacterized coiled-coil DUF342 family protein
MDKELMDTFTNEQLTMCEKESLIEYINDIKVHHDCVVMELKEKHEQYITELFRQIAMLKTSMSK